MPERRSTLWGLRPAGRPASDRRWTLWGLRALSVPVAALGAVLAVLGGVGWLYLLRHQGVLDAGPRLPEALPLQRLAGQAAQPVARLVVAWLPAGLVAGLALATITRLGRVARAALAGVVAFVVLLLANGASDAVTASDGLTSKLYEQPGRAALWLEAGLVALGAGLVPQLRRRSGRDHAERSP